MADFDPQAYLTQKTGGGQAFDPTTYLSQKLGEGPVDRTVDAVGSAYSANPYVQAAKGFAAAAKPISDLGEKYVTGPIRSGIQYLQGGGLLPGQPGASESGHPTGQQLAQNAGVPDTSLSQKFPSLYSETGRGLKLKKGGPADISASGAAGGLLEAATNPLSYALPEAAKEPVNQAGEIAAETVPKVAEAIGEGAKNTVSKVASMTSGIPEKTLEVYAKNTDEINSLAKRYDKDIASATNAMRQKWAGQITAAKKTMNQAISQGLQETYGEVPADVSGVIDKLQEHVDRLHYKYGSSDAAEIQAKIDEIKGVGGHFVPELYDLKNDLQQIAKGSYAKDGKIFATGSKFAKAAKEAAAAANEELWSIAPEIKEPDSQLSKLHQIEKKLNPNVLAEGKPGASIVAAGSEANPYQRAQLGLLQKLTGGSMVPDAEKLAAMNEFAKPKILPSGAETGFALGRMGLGYKLGESAEHVTGIPFLRYAGAAAGGPLSLKTAINAGNIVRKGAKAVGGLLKE